MNYEHNDFIGHYTNVYPDGYCQHLISEFDRLQNLGCGYSRIDSENVSRHKKDDFQIEVSTTPMLLFDNRETPSIFFDGLQNCYNKYVQQFSSLADLNVRANHIKLQKTDPGGGYHVWHSEQGNGAFAARVLVYILYLNTLDPSDAGETEFLYQQKRFQPVENSLLIWPAAFTHTHRGNTVFGKKSKYIATGWFYFT